MKIDNYIQELKLKLDKIIKRFNAEQKQIFAQIPVNITKLAISFGLNVYEFNDNKLESYICNDNIGVNSESSNFVKEVKIMNVSGGLYLIRYSNKTGAGGYRVKESRLFRTEYDAKEYIIKNKYFDKI